MPYFAYTNRNNDYKLNVFKTAQEAAEWAISTLNGDYKDAFGIEDGKLVRYNKYVDFSLLVTDNWRNLLIEIIECSEGDEDGDTFMPLILNMFALAVAKSNLMTVTEEN